MEKTLSKVVGQTIMQIAFIPGCNLSLKLQNSHSLDILLDKAFWRLSRENDIILTSDDFAVKTQNLFSHDYVPISDDEYKEFEKARETQDDVYEMEELYLYLEPVFEKRIDELYSILQNETITSVEEKRLGDFCLTLSSGIILEAFAIVDHNHKTLSQLYIIV